MVLILGGQDILTQNIGGAKHTFLPCFAPFSLDFPNYWGGSCPPCPPYNYTLDLIRYVCSNFDFLALTFQIVYLF